MPHDFEINTLLNAVLAAHYIDTSQVNVSSICGSVYVVGTMVIRGKGWASVSANLMERIDSQFKAIKGVEWIYYYLENMVHCSGKWKYLQPKKKKEETRKLTSPDENKKALASPATGEEDVDRDSSPARVVVSATTALCADATTVATEATKPIEKRAATRRAFPALAFKSRNAFSVMEFMRSFTENVKQHSPDIALEKYLGKCSQQLRQESLQYPLTNKHLGTILDLLQKHGRLGSWKLETWDEIFSRTRWQYSPQDHCASLHIFFRFLALLLLHLKQDFSHERRVQVAIEIVQNLADKNYSCLPEKNCGLQSIFQYCRKNNPFAALYCKSGQS